MSDVTRVQSPIEGVDQGAAEQLLPLVYDELRKLAADRLVRERPGQTLQPTALVHEAYMRLIDGDANRRWNSQGHFFGAAAEAMRRILIESARRKQRQKRGGNYQQMSIDRVDLVSHMAPDELMRLDESIAQLAIEDSAAAELVKLRYFSGLTIKEAAVAIGIAPSTAYRHWAFARAWLHSELCGIPE
jgi:RNA polymerase sigma factor (TIGR02999 family)